ncbi:hypothetical protein [Candidatus Spongiihabitans sp.]
MSPVIIVALTGAVPLLLLLAYAHWREWRDENVDDKNTSTKTGGQSGES